MTTDVETSGETAEAATERIEPIKLKQQVIELLEAAERVSEDVIASARADAEHLRAAAHSDVEKLTTEAKAEAENVSVEASSEAEKRVDGARATADELIAKARAEADALRGAATTETDDLRRRAKQTATTQTQRIGSLNDELAAQAVAAEREVRNLRELLESVPKQLHVEEELAESPTAETATENGSRKRGFFASLLAPRHQGEAGAKQDKARGTEERTTLAAHSN